MHLVVAHTISFQILQQIHYITILGIRQEDRYLHKAYIFPFFSCRTLEIIAGDKNFPAYVLRGRRHCSQIMNGKAGSVGETRFPLALWGANRYYSICPYILIQQTKKGYQMCAYSRALAYLSAFNALRSACTHSSTSLFSVSTVIAPSEGTS